MKNTTPLKGEHSWIEYLSYRGYELRSHFNGREYSIVFRGLENKVAVEIQFHKFPKMEPNRGKMAMVRPTEVSEIHVDSEYLTNDSLLRAKRFLKTYQLWGNKYVSNIVKVLNWAKSIEDYFSYKIIQKIRSIRPMSSPETNPLPRREVRLGEVPYILSAMKKSDKWVLYCTIGLGEVYINGSLTSLLEIDANSNIKRQMSGLSLRDIRCFPRGI